MMSVWRRLPSAELGRWKRIAIPRGLEVGSVSGIEGSPVEEEKRTVIGVEEEVK